MSDDLKKEYIKTLISVVEEDKKSVLLYVAFDLAVVSLTLSGKLLLGSQGYSLFIAVGLALLLASAGLFFDYYRKLHLASYTIADQLLTLDTGKARSIPKNVWNEHKHGYIVGYVIRLVGLATLIAVFVMPAIFEHWLTKR